MAAASQLSLLKAHRPDEVVKVAPVNVPLFDLDALDAASRTATKDSAPVTPRLRILKGDERQEAGRIWARILRAVKGRHAAKLIVDDFEREGEPVSLRTVQGWLNGRLADVEYVLIADRLYGPGIIAEIWEPGSDAAAASRKLRLRRLVEEAAR